jgi:hypothetical protein
MQFGGVIIGRHGSIRTEHVNVRKTVASKDDRAGHRSTWSTGDGPTAPTSKRCEHRPHVSANHAVNPADSRVRPVLHSVSMPVGTPSPLRRIVPAVVIRDEIPRGIQPRAVRRVSSRLWRTRRRVLLVWADRSPSRWVSYRSSARSSSGARTR